MGTGGSHAPYSGVYFFYHLKNLVALAKERGGEAIDVVTMATNKMSADRSGMGYMRGSRR